MIDLFGTERRTVEQTVLPPATLTAPGACTPR